MKYLFIITILFCITSSSVLPYEKTHVDRALLLAVRNSNCQSPQARAREIRKIVEPILKETYNGRNPKITLLMLAITLGDVEATKELLKRQHIYTNSRIVWNNNKNDYSNVNETLYYLVRKDGKKIPLDYILISESDAEKQAFSNISWAIKKPLYERDNLLIQYPDPYVRSFTDQGYTALTYAVVSGNYEIVKLILEYTYKSIRNNIFKLLTSHNTHQRKGLSRKRAIELTRAFINKRDSLSWSALNYAVSFDQTCLDEQKINERIRIVDLLIRAGAINNNVLVWEGLIDIIGLASKYGHYYIVNLILEIYINELKPEGSFMASAWSELIKKSIDSNIRVLKKSISYMEERESDLGTLPQTLELLKAWKNSM